jgi:DNA-binding NarL/FixJ family response regulator
MRTRILIAVYQQTAGYAMKLLLDEQPDMVVTGVVDNSLDLLTHVQSARPHIVLLEWELFRDLPPGFLPKQRQSDFSHVIVYGPRPELAQATLDTDAFVYEGDGPKRLLSTIRSTMLKAKYEE